MNFFCISEKRTSGAEDMLKKACETRGINFIEINTGTSKLNLMEYPDISPGDCLYRVATGSINAKKVEYCFADDNIATFYDSPETIFRACVNVRLAKNNIPIPKTIPVLTSNRVILKKYADYLGFPLILKSLGGKEGVGVMRIDSIESLNSVADYLYRSEGNYILREYIDVRESVRAIVLKDKVIASIKYKASNSGDFRSNRRSGFDNIDKYDCPPEIGKVAVGAVQCLGLEFGGVDVLIDSENKPYVLEVNFPCNFAETQIATGIDVAGQIVDYLKSKSEKIN